MASITVKKFDGTTDIVYDAVASSGGDNSPALWRQDTGAAAGKPVGQRPILKLNTKWNGPKTARQCEFEFAAPYSTQDSTTTVYSSRDRVVFRGTVTVPQNIPATELNEATYQLCNLIGSLLIKQSLAAGFAPT
jgi:hypothetical protein